MSHYDHRNNQDDRGYDHQRDDYNHQPLTKTFYNVASEEFEKKRKPERELLYKNLFSVVQDNGLEALRTETIPFVHISAAFEGNTKLGQTSWPVEISYVEFSIDRGVHAEETLAVKFLPFPLFGMRMQELEQQRHQVLDDAWMCAKETGINATAETTFHPQRVWERLAQIIGYPEAKWKIYVEATAWNATVGGIVSLAKIRHEDDERIEKLKCRFRCLEDAAVAFLAVARNRDHFDPRLIVAYKGLAEYGMEVKSDKEFNEPQCVWHEEHFPRHRPNRVRCSLRRSHANISNFLRLADENALVGFHNKFGSCIDSNRATPPNRFEGASPFYGDSRQRQCEGDHSPPRRPPSPPRRQEMVERPRHYENSQNRAVDMKKAEPIVSPVAPPPAREEPLIQEQHPRLKKEYLAPTVDLYDCTESEWDDDRTAVHMIKMGLREGKPCDPQHRPPGKVVLDEVLKVERTRNGKGRTTSTRSSALALAPAYARLKPGNVNNAVNNLKNGYINGENKINSADRNVNSSVCLSSEGAPRGEESRGSATSTTRTSTASSSSIGDVVPTLSAAPTFGNLLNVD